MVKKNWTFTSIPTFEKCYMSRRLLYIISVLFLLYMYAKNKAIVIISKMGTEQNRIAKNGQKLFFQTIGHYFEVPEQNFHFGHVTLKKWLSSTSCDENVLGKAITGLEGTKYWDSPE